MSSKISSSALPAESGGRRGDCLIGGESPVSTACWSTGQNPRSVESLAKVVARRRNTFRNCLSTSAVSRVWATVASYNKLMWAGSSSSSGLVSVWAASRLGGSNDGANGFKLCGAVPTARGDVSSVTQKVGARALFDPLSVTAGPCIQRDTRSCFRRDTRNWRGLGRQAGRHTIGKKLGLYCCKNIFRNRWLIYHIWMIRPDLGRLTIDDDMCCTVANAYVTARHVTLREGGKHASVTF